jgi:hypothetical protein
MQYMYVTLNDKENKENLFVKKEENDMHDVPGSGLQ